MVTNEHQLADWLLAQQLLNEAGLLPTDKVAQLDQVYPGWMDGYESTSGSHAIVCDDEDLHQAFEAWWNAMNMPGSPMTFAEIRVKAAMESGD